MSAGFAEALKASGQVRVEPQRLLGDRGRSEPYPIEATGDILGRVIRAIMHRVQVPDAIAAHSVLAAASLAVQGHVLIQMPTGEKKPPSLFFATVADSGDRKTTSDNIACEAIKDFEIDLNTDYQLQKATHAAHLAIYNSDKAQLAKDHKGSDRAVVDQAVKDLGSPPPEPMRPLVMVPPGSTQGVIDTLDKGRPSIGLFINEGGSWLGSWGMQDENRTATISAYSEMWDGQPIKTLTKGEGHRFMPNRAFAFHVMFQPVYVEKMFGDEEMRGQGFLSRMLAAQPTSLAGSRFRDVNAAEPPEVEDAIVAYTERLSRIIRAPLPIDAEFPMNGLSRRRWISFSPEAAELFWKFYNHIERQQVTGGDLAGIRGFAGKATEQAARLATVTHIFENGMQSAVLPGAAMARGVALMNFYLGEALRLADCAPQDANLVRAQEVSDWLEKKWSEPNISVRVIRQFGPSKLRGLSSDEVRHLCGVLARHDHITACPSGGEVKGRHEKEAWRVHVGR